jgi:hypothetical protein
MPVDTDRISQKFYSNAAHLYAPAAANALATTLLEGEPSARDIMRLASTVPRVERASF